MNKLSPRYLMGGTLLAHVKNAQTDMVRIGATEIASGISVILLL